MGKPLTADDVLPMVASLTTQERARLLRSTLGGTHIGAIPVIDTVMTVIFIVEMAGVLLWLWLCTRLFRHLEHHHHHVYDTIDRPSLFSNDTPRNNLLF